VWAEEVGKKAVKINWGYKISTFLNQVNENHGSQILWLLEQLKSDFCSVQMIQFVEHVVHAVLPGRKPNPHYLHSLHTFQHTNMQTLFNAYGHAGIAKEFGEWWLVGVGLHQWFVMLK
jgi:hypothetical protein